MSTQINNNSDITSNLIESQIQPGENLTSFQKKENKNETNDVLKGTDIIINIIKYSFPTILFFLGITMQSTLSYILLNLKYSDTPDKAIIMKEGMGFSIFIFNISMLSLIVGLISGFEILGSAAFGAKKYDLIGIY